MLQFDADTAAFLSRAYAGRDATRRRQANLDALDPRAGETVLDLGCGNGMLLPELHRAMNGAGRIIGVDVSADMLAEAARTAEGLATVELAEGSARAIPLPDASVDRIVSIQVFEYVPDVAAALAECARVLKPGGRLVIGDLHFGTLVWASDDPGRMSAVLRAYEAHCVHLDLPAHLPGLMRGAGFSEIATLPHHMDDFTLRSDGLAATMLTFVSRYLEATPHGPELARDWAEEQRARARAGTFFFSISHFITAATRS